jgi:hypothetical protein
LVKISHKNWSTFLLQKTEIFTKTKEGAPDARLVMLTTPGLTDIQQTVTTVLWQTKFEKKKGGMY